MFIFASEFNFLSIMRYYCIYEINKKTKDTSFVENFDEAFNEAEEFCIAMNNFSSSDIYYCVRCLDSNEFKNKDSYNPIFSRLYVNS